MTGLEKITSQILEEAKTSAAMKLETAQKQADDILAKAMEECAAMEAEAAEKNAVLKKTMRAVSNPRQSSSEERRF